MPVTEKEDAKTSGPSMTNISIFLIVVLVLLALIAGANSGSSGPNSPPPLASSAPTRVTVPSISAESSLVPTGLQPDGRLAVPPLSEPMQASWFDQSPTPGEVGPSVVLGHVNGNGQPGIFVNLKDVVAGAQVFVDRADGQRAVFEVSRVETIPKDSFPTDSVYNDTANPQLRLITCGGTYDQGERSYRSNVIVYADLVEVQRV